MWTDAGYHKGTQTAWLSALREFDEENVAATISSVKFCQKPNIIRKSLETHFGKEEAHRRWPVLFPRDVDKFDTSRWTITCAPRVTVLQKEFETIPGVGSDITVRRLQIMIKQNVPVVMDKFGKLFMRTDLELVPTRIRALVLLRWGQDAAALKLFAGICTEGSRRPNREPVIALAYVILFYDLCVLISPVGHLMKRLRCITRRDVIDLVRERGRQNMKGRIGNLIHQFSEVGAWASNLPEWNNWRTVKRAVVGYKRNRKQRSRESMTEEELYALFAEAEKDVFDHALARLYLHTGMRRCAATEMLVENVWTGDFFTGHCLTNGKTLEKFNTMRNFTIDPILGAALAAQIRDRWRDKSVPGPVWVPLPGGPPKYVFPSAMHNHQMLHPSLIFKWIHDLTKRAGIHGDFVHVHGLRHTVATLLRKIGNSMEDISKQLGHKNVSTTEGYIDSTVSRPEDTMYIPWIHGAQPLATPMLMSGMMSADTSIGSPPLPRRNAVSATSPTSPGSNRDGIAAMLAMLESERTTKEEAIATCAMLVARTKELEEIIDAKNREIELLQEARLDVSHRYNSALGVMPPAMRANLHMNLYTQAADDIENNMEDESDGSDSDEEH